MATLTINCLGQFTVTISQQSVPSFRTDKVRALLVYLALEARSQRRSALAALLWPDIGEHYAEKNLRNTLYRLRQPLQAIDPIFTDQILISTRQTITLDPARRVTDVQHFEQLISDSAIHARTMATGGVAAMSREAHLAQCPDCLARLTEAAALYIGELLAGFSFTDAPIFEEWLVVRREALHQQMVVLLFDLALAYVARSEWGPAQHYARRLLGLEPWREEVHRLLMQMFAQSGQRSAALAQYHQCHQILKEELDIEPDVTTMALYEAIRRGEFDKVTERQGEGVTELVEVTPSPCYPVTLASLHDWGEMPAIDFFAGRAAEVALLTAWLTPPNEAQHGAMPPIQLISVIGMGGMGKTTLTAMVTRDLAARFAVVIWRSLLNAPTLSELLRDWLQVLARQTLTTMPTSLDEQLRLLLTYLRQERCLLVLDNVESIFMVDAPHGGAQGPAGAPRPGYEGYEQLFLRLATSDHQSCLLLTSREQPYALARLGRQAQETTGRIRKLGLSGLDLQAGHQLLQSNGLHTSPQDGARLIQNYSGNPLALQIVAATIADFFDGDIGAFQCEEGTLFDGIRLVLDQQFARLSTLERDILIWLAIEREAVTMPTLRNNFVQPVTTSALVEALQALQNRSFLEKSDSGLSLQNVIIEYTTEHLIEQICQELIVDASEMRNTGDIGKPTHPLTSSYFNRFALMRASAKEYVRQSQLRLIVQPIADRLSAQWGKLALVTKINEQLARVRATPPRTPGYAAGNLLTLLRHWRLDCTGYDFSRLCVWGVDFCGARFTDLNFAEADLAFCTFTLTIKGYALKLRATEELLVGDLEASNVMLWVLSGNQSLSCHRHLRSNGGNPMVFNGASAGGPLFFAGAGIDFTVRVWSVDEQRLVHSLTSHRNQIYALAINDPGTLLASGGADQTICIWDLRSGELLHKLNGQPSAIRSLAFAPVSADQAVDTMSAILFSGSLDGTVQRWEIQRGQVVNTWGATGEEVRSLSVAPDHSLLASGHIDGTIHLWDGVTGQRLAILTGHGNSVNVLAFHSGLDKAPEGRQRLASGGSDHAVLLWDVQRNGHSQLLYRLIGHGDEVQHLSFSPDGQRLASASAERTIRLWDTSVGHPIELLTGYLDVVRTVRFSPDGRLVASGGGDGIVRLWEVGCTNLDPAQEPVVRYLAAHTRHVQALAFSPDGRLLASASTDQTIALWDVQSGQLLQTLYGHSGPVLSLAFHPTQPLLASGGADHTIRLWERQRNAIWGEAQSPRWLGHHARLFTLAFHPAGHTLVSGSEDHTLALWDVAIGTQSAVLTGHTAGVTAVDVSPNGQLIASSGGDYTVRLWQADNGAELLVRSGERLGGQCVAFAVDSEMMAYGAEEISIEVWNARTQQVVHTLRGHTSTVLTLAFSPVAPLLVSGGWDGTVRMWDLQSGQCLQTLRAPGPYAGMNIRGVTGISEAQKAALRALGAVAE